MTTQPLTTATPPTHFPPLGPLLSNEAPAGATIKIAPDIAPITTAAMEP